MRSTAGRVRTMFHAGAKFVAQRRVLESRLRTRRKRPQTQRQHHRDPDRVRDRVDREGARGPHKLIAAAAEQRTERDRRHHRRARTVRSAGAAARRRRGAAPSALNAGSLQQRASPMTRAEHDELPVLVAEHQRERDQRREPVGDDQRAPRTEAIDGHPAERAEHRGRNRPRQRQQCDLARTRVKAVRGVAPERNERAPAANTVHGLADQEQHEATVAERRHRRKR